ncbi:hypothetical protein N333_03904, partial [Nestor notabilis]
CQGWAVAPKSWSRSWCWCRGCWCSMGWPLCPARTMCQGS